MGDTRHDEPSENMRKELGISTLSTGRNYYFYCLSKKGQALLSGCACCLTFTFV